MKAASRWLGRVFDFLVNAGAVVSCALLVFLALSICYDVFMRYFLQSPRMWVNDVTGYILLTVTFLGGAYLLREDGHTRVDVVLLRMSLPSRRVFMLISYSLVLIVCVALTVAAAYTVWDNYVRGIPVIRTIEVPKFLVLSPIVVGGAMISVQSLIMLWYVASTDRNEDRATRPKSSEGTLG